jgi:hypothetical protein
VAEGTTLLTWRGIKPLESSNLSLSAVNGVSEDKEKANCLAFERDEKAGAMSGEYA